MSRSRRKTKGRRESESYLALPHPLVKSPQFARLSSKAVKLLIDIASEYNGRNNGNLAATLKPLRKKGWTSNDTLTKARNELVETGFIVLTRQGGLHCGPNLYAITWRGIDESNGRHEAMPSDRPLDLWKNRTSIPYTGTRCTE